MKRIAVPMVGGVVTSFLMELLVYPAIFFVWRGRNLPPGDPTPLPSYDEGIIAEPENAAWSVG